MATINVREYGHVPGVRLPDEGMPDWRANMLQEKNMKIITNFLADEDVKRKEDDRWKAIPDWKKKLMLEKEKKKKDEQREKEEAEKKEKAKLEKLPEWKKQFLNKKQAESSQLTENTDHLNISPAETTTISDVSSLRSEDGKNSITEP